MTPSEKIGIKQDSKRAVIYDALHGRVEATSQEIASAIKNNGLHAGLFSEKGIFKEVSDTMRQMAASGLLEREENEDKKIYYWVANSDKVEPLKDEPEVLEMPEEVTEILETVKNNSESYEDFGIVAKTVYITPSGSEYINVNDAIEEVENYSNEDKCGIFLSKTNVLYDINFPGSYDEALSLLVAWENKRAKYV